ncbi:hypothetical protein [Rheinheimera sediminis]|uniref:hypothetical protein n=1 Tax=Rheinheimera sp. YQF-1 TaxID=2499626 RepID=UPI001645F6F4|nr:hypothetical protein [Rheinheimera sp. YQF-1]
MPNNMLNQANYAKVINEALPLTERQQAFNEREFWLDDLPIGPSTDYMAQINSMIDHFADLAVVLPQSKAGISDFPAVMQVGMTPDKPMQLLNARADKQADLRGMAPEQRRPDLSQTDKANRLSKR